LRLEWLRVCFSLAGALCLVACGARSGLEAFANDGGTAPPPADTSTSPLSCTERGVTYIYVITDDEDLYRFDPTRSSFGRIGPVRCPTTSTANSMAVDRGGTAYVGFHDGSLFEVDVGTAACRPTPYVPLQFGWTTFGMGYASDTTDPGETLYVAESDFEMPSVGLGTIDTNTFTLHEVGPFLPPLESAVELTGTGDGRLYALAVSQDTGQSYIAEVDPSTARVSDPMPLFSDQTIDAFAFAFWGGDFYTFTSLGAGTRVHRIDPSNSSIEQVASLAAQVVGAGVSTCAPE